MAALKQALFVLFLSLFVAGTAHAEVGRDSTFDGWLQSLEQEAVSEGVTSATAHRVLNDIVLDDRVLILDEKQPEHTITFEDYLKRVVTPARIAEGRRQMAENAGLLNVVSTRYGVPPQLIVALWGVESSFGHNSGDYSIVDSLATLAYGGRRSEFFRKELINALHIIDQHNILPSSMRGSWAGAMGQCQFMPSTYLHYAVSYDGGNPDIWENTADVFASIANYISADGWTGDQGWGREVELDHQLPDGEIGLDQKHSLAEWSGKGVQGVGGDALPNLPVYASLVAPDGNDGRYFLVYDNYRALMRWNRSTFFATSVGILADRIK